MVLGGSGSTSCELHLSGKCSGMNPRAFSHVWFDSGPLLGPQPPIAECQARQKAWQSSCGMFVTVKMRLTSKTTLAKTAVQDPSQKRLCSLPSWIKVFFLFGSTPSRAHRLPTVLKMMRAQSRPPDAVILSIPRRYRRFNESYELGSSAGDPLLRVHRMSWDAGPLGKYHGVKEIGRVDDRGIIVVGDDDVNYASTFLEDFACAVTKGNTREVFTGHLDPNFGPFSPGTTGFSGVGCRVEALRPFVAMLRWPQQCFLQDDIPASYYFTKVRGYQVKEVAIRSQNADEQTIWRSSSSINKFHSDNGFRINEMCWRAIVAEVDSDYLGKQPRPKVG